MNGFSSPVVPWLPSVTSVGCRVSFFPPQTLSCDLILMPCVQDFTGTCESSFTAASAGRCLSLSLVGREPGGFSLWLVFYFFYYLQFFLFLLLF